MKLISWNVNGIRAIVKKDFFTSITKLNPDVLCLQETKAQISQVKEALMPLLENYHIVVNEAEKKGYSGTAILSKKQPLDSSLGIGIEKHDKEGRVIKIKYDNFFLVNVYTPNSKNDLSRINYRKEWDELFFNYLKTLEKELPVIVCGDLNVAHTNIDLANPKANYNKSAGFTQIEIDGLEKYLANGFIDTYRLFNPNKIQYTWWSYRMNARLRNVGWRIDYFLCSKTLKNSLENSTIYDSILDSDHCPVNLNIF